MASFVFNPTVSNSVQTGLDSGNMNRNMYELICEEFDQEMSPIFQD